MNLPLVLDLALGLVFIYLILSLLASEIQELIATVLQWRAEHLKKSIEILLSGDNQTNPADQKFANELYRSPLVKALNQEAKGPIATLFRRISQAIGDLYRTLTRTRNVFGELRSGPSYMPAETFAVALLQKLDIESISQKLGEQTIAQFIQEKLNLVEEILESLRNSTGDDSLLESEFNGLKRNLNQVTAAYIQRRTTLAIGLNQAIEQLNNFINNTEAMLGEDDPAQAIIRKRLPYLRQAILSGKLEPTIAEAISFILNSANQTNLSPELAAIVSQIRQSSAELPQELRQSLSALAKQAQTKAASLDQGVLQLQKEVEVWFDRSMERASGVYRRNAKGIAILIGVSIAAATNADTFHIVSRLSKDSILRNSISQTAEQVVMQTAQTTSAPGTDIQTDLQAVRDAVDDALEGLPIPIGWGGVNVEQQRLEGASWRVPFLRQVLGWMVTGIALSMGANFWYQVLSRVIRVRSTGTSRNSSTPDGE